MKVIKGDREPGPQGGGGGRRDEANLHLSVTWEVT